MIGYGELIYRDFLKKEGIPFPNESITFIGGRLPGIDPCVPRVATTEKPDIQFKEFADCVLRLFLKSSGLPIKYLINQHSGVDFVNFEHMTEEVEA